MTTKLHPANNIGGAENLSTQDLDYTINADLHLEEAKSATRHIVDNSYIHLRDDNKLLKLVNENYSEYFYIYKELYPDGGYIFLEDHDIEIKWPFQFKDVLETQEINTEREFAIFMYKALKLYVYLIWKDNPDFTSTNKMTISQVLYKLFLSLM